MSLLLFACGGGSSATDGGPAGDGGGARDLGAASDAAVSDSAVDLGVRDAGSADLGPSPDLGGDGDAGAAMDGSTGVACGSAVCGDGQQCCSPSCGLCAPVGALCPAITCLDGGAPDDAGPPYPDGGTPVACTAQAAHGEGTCDHLLGYAYDGLACVPVRGCTCAGADCAHLYTTLAACDATTAWCVAPAPVP